MNATHTFPSTPGAVARARHYAVACLGDVPDEALARVALMISELVTNCVLHASTEFVVELDATPERVHVAVTDHGDGEPIVRSPRPTDLSGRGLHIVQQLADEFGVERLAATGKTVWFTVRLSERPHSLPASL